MVKFKYIAIGVILIIIMSLTDFLSSYAFLGLSWEQIVLIIGIVLVLWGLLAKKRR